MLGKSWKKILLLVLIVACLFNIVTKLIKRNSLKEELKATLNYKINKQQIEVNTLNNEEEKNNNNNEKTNNNK